MNFHIKTQSLFLSCISFLCTPNRQRTLLFLFTFHFVAMFWFPILVLGLLLVALVGLMMFIYGNDNYWPSRKIPLVKGSDIGPFFDRLLIRIPFSDLTLNIYNSLKAHGKGVKFGGMMEFRRPVAVIMDPELIKNITVKDFDNFVNRRPFGRKDDLLSFGPVLFNLENQEWKNLRSAMTPTFSSGKLKRMFTIFTQSSNRMIEFMTQQLGSSKEVELRDVCSRYTLDVIASSAFGVDSQVFLNKDSIFAMMGNRLQKQFSGLKIFKVFMSMLLPELYKFLRLSMMDIKAFTFFSDIIRQSIEHRRKTGERRMDFLQLLIDARYGHLNDEMEGDESSSNSSKLDKDASSKSQKSSAVEWTDDLILAQCLVFFLAGADTNETLLIFTLYELALNPHVQERLVEEIEQIVTADGLSYDAINQNEYLDMVVSETMRKYTPAPRLERICAQDYHVPGTSHIIPAGQVCMIPVYGLHHDPDYFPDPFKYIPERFTAENKMKRNPYTYIPFGVGPRHCIAMRFALIQGKCAIAHFVRHFKVEPCSKTHIPMQFDSSGQMKPKNGMWLKVSRRAN